MPATPSERPPLPPKTAERRALDAALQAPGFKVLCTTLGRAQLARAIAIERPAASVACWFLDQHPWRLSHTADLPQNLALTCQPDLPPDPVELAVLPLPRQGEAELARDLLQAAAERLVIGGTLIAAVDNPHDRWLRAKLQQVFSKVSVQSHPDATVYLARKQAEPRLRDFRCRFAFRDRGRLLQAMTRPGVFAHRRIDAGARQLLAAAEVQPNMRVLDIGCGAGTVALALAARDPTALVHAVDGNARAVECTLAGAEMNGLQNVTAELNSTGRFGAAGAFDLAVANPPYYADHRIAQLFLDAARRSLRSGGRVLIVAKHPQWYAATMPGGWRDLRHWPSKQYHLIEAVRP